MIIVKLMGGLGNQMFQYAIGRKLSLKLNAPLFLDISTYTNYNGFGTPREFKLDHYRALYKIADNELIQKYSPSFLDYNGVVPLLRKTGFKIANSIFNRTLFIENTFGCYNSNFEKLKGHIYLNGYWQNQEYFRDIRQVLLEDFSIRSDLTNEYLPLANKVIYDESVSIHIRRGDYTHNTDMFDLSANNFEYYKKAIDYLYQKTQKDLRFNIFSDDIDWCKSHFPISYNIDFMSVNTHSDVCELHVMNHCKHNIIANSSYSWWGAWLNKNPEKIVIAPKNWYKQKKSTQTDIIPLEWIKF